jgi:hypothetical protein
MGFIVVEFDDEIRYPDGRPSGSRRGWVDAGDPEAVDLLYRARPIALVATEEEARALCNDAD